VASKRKALLLVAVSLVALVAVASVIDRSPPVTTRTAATVSVKGGRIVQLNWVEKPGPAEGLPATMKFTVETVTVAKNAWSVRAAFTNRSSRPVQILTDKDFYFPAQLFGLLKPATCQRMVGQPRNCPSGVLQATTLNPPAPTSLAPGGVWVGTFSGPGTLPNGRLINITFGAFHTSRNFSWTMGRAFRL
jgi:hypothetical protein